MKQMRGLAVLALTATLGVSGCARTEYVEVTPRCTPPSQPALPLIDMGETWELLGDARYRELERYVNGLWAAHDEAMAMLGVLCGGDDAR